MSDNRVAFPYQIITNSWIPVMMGFLSFKWDEFAPHVSAARSPSTNNPLISSSPRIPLLAFFSRKLPAIVILYDSNCPICHNAILWCHTIQAVKKYYHDRCFPIKSIKRPCILLYFNLNKYCKARSCIWPRPYDPDFDLSMSDLLGICYEAVAENLRWVPKLLHGIYRTGVTWRDQNLSRKVEVSYMDEPCNAC